MYDRTFLRRDLGGEQLSLRRPQPTLLGANLLLRSIEARFLSKRSLKRASQPTVSRPTRKVQPASQPGCP